MLCKQCGSELHEGEKFCASCGTAVPAREPEQSQSDLIAEISRIDAQAAQAPSFDYTEQPAPVYAEPAQNREITEADLPEQYKPIRAWGYFGLQLLYAIPIVGFIFLIIHSASNGNVNRRNFARSYWCALIIAGCLSVLYLIFAVVLVFFTRSAAVNF